MTNPILPSTCATRTRMDNQPIVIVRGESGYRPSPGLDVDAYNNRRGVTIQEIQAMTIGSMFGWDCPGADPARYDSKGKPVK